MRCLVNSIFLRLAKPIDQRLKFTHTSLRDVRGVLAFPAKKRAFQIEDFNAKKTLFFNFR
jgi:hypothetical protein